MKWKVVLRPEIRRDIAEASAWYDRKVPGLSRDLVFEVISVFQSLAANPYLNARRSRRANVRWRLTKRFPYRIVYEIRELESTVLVVAVIHAARHERHWKKRME